MKETNKCCTRCGLPQSEWKGRWQDPLCKVGETTYELHTTHPMKETNTCDCEEMTCPENCVFRHTHKTFFCEKCKERRWIEDPHQKAALEAARLSNEDMRKTYEQSERSHRHCFNDQEGHEKHLSCCICGTHPTSDVEAVYEEIRKLVFLRPATVEDALEQWDKAQELLTTLTTVRKEAEARGAREEREWAIELLNTMNVVNEKDPEWHAGVSAAIDCLEEALQDQPHKIEKGV